MRTLALTLVAVLVAALPARGQSAAAIAVGLCVSTFNPRSDRVIGASGIGPVLRLKSGPGRHTAVGFSWFGATAQAEVDGQVQTVGRVRVRPVMVGPSYAMTRDPYALTFSAVAGWAFTSISVNETTRAAYRDSVGASYVSVAVGDSLAWRAQVAFWYDVAPRVGLMASLSYMVVRPSLELTTDRGREVRRVRADPVIFGFGLVYGVF